MKFFYTILLLFIHTYLLSQVDVFSLVRSNDLAGVKTFIKSQPSTIDNPNADGFSILILAAYKGNYEMVEFLLKEGANINFQSEMGTALTAAVFKGNIELSTFLLTNKANPNLTDFNGVTPLIYAVQFKNKDMIKLLQKFNADKSLVDKKGKTAFEYAVFSNDEELINLFK